jgi:hypothetical protein
VLDRPESSRGGFEVCEARRLYIQRSLFAPMTKQADVRGLQPRGCISSRAGPNPARGTFSPRRDRQE